ncbi:MAG TPA: c-type cytochrome [Herbaspirillum sp.]|jgi:cytochrome c553|nr:c-type cytochrome [Herbaspirillum sp.]
MAITDKHIGHPFSNDICAPAPAKKRMIALRFCLSAFAAFIVFANTSHAQTAVGGDTGTPASAATCFACHGALGAGSSAAITPRLAGQNPDYLAHALSMFKDRTRASDTMQGIAQNLSDSDIHALALYFSKQHPPRAQDGPAPDPHLVAAGKQLAEIGAGPGVAACFSCHAAGGKGNGARFPSIAGQPESFLIKRLHDFQARAKKSTPGPGTMMAVSATLSEAQIRQAAAYLSSIEP